MPKHIAFDAWPPDDSFGKFDGTTIDDEYTQDLFDSFDPTTWFDTEEGAFDTGSFPDDGAFGQDSLFEELTDTRPIGEPDLAFEIEESAAPVSGGPFVGGHPTDLGNPVPPWSGGFGAPPPDAPVGNPIPQFGYPTPAGPAPAGIRVLQAGPDGVYRVYGGRGGVGFEPESEPISHPVELSPYMSLPVSKSFSIKGECSCRGCDCEG